jgi:branched-chain amino acid transport system permease protein
MSRAERLRAAALVALLVGALVVLVPTLLPSFWLFLAISAVAAAVVAHSVGIVGGEAGMIVLCPLSFAAAGAWISCWFATHAPGVPFVLQMVCAALVAAVVGAVVGLPALRLRGVNLAVVTLGVAAAVSTVLAVVGFPGSDAYVTVGRPSGFETPAAYFRFCCIVFVVLALLTTWATRTRVGAAWRMIRRSERAAASLGLSMSRVKLGAFAASAAIAAIGGCLMAGQLGLITPRSFEPLASLSVFALAVMVGARFPEGALLAGVLSVFLPELLRRAGLSQDWGNVLFAVGAIQALAAGAGVAEIARRRLRARRLRRLAALPAPPPTRAARQAHTPRVTRSGDGPVLEAVGVRVRYGQVVALDGVDVAVQTGSVHGLIGPNGSGKTTFIDAVTGFVVSEGDVRLDGASLRRAAAHRRAAVGLRRTFQQQSASEELSVEQYLRLAAGGALDAWMMAEALEVIGASRASTRIGELDVGSRRLVEVMGTVAARPTVVLLDEPAAGLGPQGSAALAAHIAAIPARYGCSVVVVEHDMQLVHRACDEVTVLDHGAVLAQGAPQQVLQEERVVTAYLGQEVAVA